MTNTKESTIQPTDYPTFLWAIEQQFKFGATSKREALQMAIDWGFCGGMELPSLRACIAFHKTQS